MQELKRALDLTPYEIKSFFSPSGPYTYFPCRFFDCKRFAPIAPPAVFCESVLNFLRLGASGVFNFAFSLFYPLGL